jgi:hypothetical protein
MWWLQHRDQSVLQLAIQVAGKVSQSATNSWSVLSRNGRSAEEFFSPR